MTFHETIQLLALISSVDSRKFTNQSPDMWHEIVGDLDYGTAKAAVVAHFRTPGAGYLTPQAIREQIDKANVTPRSPWPTPFAELELDTTPASPEHIAACKAEALAALAAARGPIADTIAETFEQIEAAATADPHPFEDEVAS